MRWVFVCTANISRSPYAERRMAQLLGDSSAVEVASAGIPGFDGRPMDPLMAAQLEARGADAADHSSRILTEGILRDADLVLAMEFSHHMAILEKWPWASGRVRGLGQFAKSAQRNSMVWDIADPYRRGRGAAKKAALQIDQYLTDVLPLAR